MPDAQIPLSQSPLDEAANLYNASPTEANMERLIENARGLVYHFAKLYGGGCRFDDLAQTGMEGLLKAVKNYCAGHGTKFSTYASHCIIGEIRHFVRKEASFYTPGCIAGLQTRVNRIIDERLKSTGVAPDADEIAGELGVREENVTEIMSAGLVDFSEVDTENIKTVRYASFRLPIEDKLFVEQAFKKLSDLQKKVIYLLFYRDLSQNEVADRLGISQRQVSRIKAKSITEMRGYDAF